MQAFRNNPTLAIGLLVVALLILLASWWFFMRTPEPNVSPVQPPPPAPTPEKQANPI
ncbi:hypothetical protein HRbin15_00796 [bacterium HR15]|nr:hypothetical protein HRbin15_00796 [bacterium HR15]